jgi:outer membrane receptor protein involved in Fe transport
LLKGLTIAANYTHLETEGKFAGTQERSTKQVPNFIPRAANLRLLWNYKKWGASASVNFTGEHILTFSAVTRAADVYRRDLRTVNAGATYKLRPNTTLYLDASNIFEEGPERYRFVSTRPTTLTIGSLSLNLGVSGQF